MKQIISILAIAAFTLGEAQEVHQKSCCAGKKKECTTGKKTAKDCKLQNHKDCGGDCKAKKA